MDVIQARELREYFELLTSAYQRDDDGQQLVYWFRNDWALFDHPRLEDLRAKELLAEILDDGDIVRYNFVPIQAESARVNEWAELRNELMHRNRFFPQTSIDLEGLERLLYSLSLEPDEIPTIWYRARLEPQGTVFIADDMGAPPNRVASHGRANPAGIPYLYLGSKPDTSIAEVRPHTGETACVAKFQTDGGLRLIDLQRPRKTISPFLSDDIVRMRSELPFLERLGQELTRPVLPQSAAIDYTPSQFLCEFIKRCGYDGVLYRSSVSDGVNLALFYPTRAKCDAIFRYTIERVTVSAVPL